MEFFSPVTLCMLMYFPIHIDTIIMGLPIVPFKGLQVEFSKICVSAPEGCFNRVPTEIQKHNSMIFHDFHDQQCNLHDYIMHSLQPTLLAVSSPR